MPVEEKQEYFYQTQGSRPVNVAITKISEKLNSHPGLPYSMLLYIHTQVSCLNPSPILSFVI